MAANRKASMALALALSLAGGLAVAGGGGGLCYEQMWSGIKQSTDLGGGRCDGFTNCPASIKCYAGRVSLNIGSTVTMQVPCEKYKGGTWDESKQRCVGGERIYPSPWSDEIKVEVCTDGCN